MNRAKRVRLQKIKFIRNMIIGLISLAIIAFILNTAPGYRRNMFADEINLIINGRNFTERLENEIYINYRGTIFISMDDIYNLFDRTIYHDKENEQIITTSDKKVAVLNFENDEMKVNDAIRQIASRAIKRDEVIYIPISEMGIVYNIRIVYFGGNKILSIEDLSREVIVANVTENTPLRFRPRRLSRNVTELTRGQRVRGFHLTSNNWRLVQTEVGQVRICKSK